MNDIKKALLDCGYIKKDHTKSTVDSNTYLETQGKSQKLFVSLDSIIFTPVNSQISPELLRTGSVVFLGLSNLVESCSPVKFGRSATPSPLHKINPQLATSMDVENIENGHQNMTPRSLIIKEFQSELEIKETPRRTDYWAELLRNQNDIIPESFGDE